MDNKNKDKGITKNKKSFNNNSKKTKEIIKKSQNNKTGKAKNTEITDWFYMTSSEVNAKSIAQLIETQCHVSVDLWEEMNILQIQLDNKVTIDFEPMVINFKESSDMEFINNQNIKTIFAVYVASGVLEEEFKKILKVILKQWNGFLCADSENFQPIYGISDL